MPAKRKNHRATPKRKSAHARSKKQTRLKNKSKQRAAGALKKRKRGSARVRADQLNSFVKASAQVLNLPIEPEWERAVRANLATILRLASSFADFPLPDEAEPAPAFTA
jgi:1-carboxybiuret hydrolase subunit AtzG-like